MEGEVVTGMEAITTAMKTALEVAAADSLSIIANVMPAALSIVCAVIVVSTGIRVFKRITGR